MSNVIVNGDKFKLYWEPHDDTNVYLTLRDMTSAVVEIWTSNDKQWTATTIGIPVEIAEKLGMLSPVFEEDY